ncbi:MAG: DUF362 domain-containing protein [Bacteroidales bacterium]|nr:DUF362 domain-containing protein [Bacteroidales bacterium]
MIFKDRIQYHKLRGRLEIVRDWMRNHHIPEGLLFVITGILSTIWFLIRVIPKPSRAAYPCMRVAAPFMSGFIIYLLTVGGLTFASRKLKLRIINVRYLSAFFLMFAVIVAVAINPSGNSAGYNQDLTTKTGPDDLPNQPIGTALGINPGRVVWAWDTAATKRNCTSYYFKPGNTDQKVVTFMFSQSLNMLTGEASVAKSWDSMFRYFNSKRHQENRGYTPGEKIFIKINQTSGRGRLREAERAKGNFYYPASHNHQSGEDGSPDLGTCETSPFLVLQILRQLINDCGIEQQDIAVGDPQNPTYGHNFDAWSTEFPDVVYTDRTAGSYGRTLIHPTRNDLLFYSDKFQTDKLYDIIEDADYMINVANLKPHSGTGITLTAKNHFGSQSRSGAYHLHYSHLSQIEGKPPTNAGYHKYRVLVDLMGSKYLGQNTILYVIDGLYAGGASEGGPPVKYFMAPFNGNWSSSVFISQDQVALESVCYDFLRTEWNGTYSHDPSNNFFEAMPDINGVDDYLHQAADSSNWPKGIVYDPDNSGKPIPSLGIHEHWNNPVNKQYSRNLGKDYGIDLVSIPAGITGMNAPKMDFGSAGMKLGVKESKNPVSKNVKAEAVLNPATGKASMAVKGKSIEINSVINRSFRKGFKPGKFYAAVLDDNNGKYFLTDAGVIRGDLFSVDDNMHLSEANGKLSDLANVNNAVVFQRLKSFVYELSGSGPLLWIATDHGAVAAPVHEESGITDAVLYDTSNADILSNNILSVALGRNRLRWFGTGKGISALLDNKWLTPAYQEVYPESLFRYYPITSMATTSNGDSLYVGTEGGGVSRVFRDNVDAISGASSYLQWGPIEMPSDTVYSICITRDGTQWIGTNNGVARHAGYNTLENWTVFNTANGLIDNVVQTIAADPYGRYVWVGTKGGLSVYDGSVWSSFTVKDGLISDNILFIMIDKNGLVYLGTDNGIMVYSEGKLACYK